MQGFINRGLGQTIKMGVAKLILQETGTYNPQYQRPYKLEADGYMVNTIVNRVVEYGSGHISGELLAGVAGQALKPTAETYGEIVVPGGWMDKRVRFVIELHCDYGYANVIYYIQGYTNFAGVTQANVAPDMQFYINSITGVTRNTVPTPMGLQVIDTPKDVCQVLAGGNTFGSMMQQTPKYLMRPHDIFTGMHTEYIRNAADIRSTDGILDNRSQIRSEPVRSLRSYGLPTNYMASVIDDFARASESLQFGQSEQDALSRARQVSQDSLLSENPFIRFISDIRGMGTVNHFTFQDLCRLDPNTPNVTNIIVVPAIQQMTVHHAGQTEFWHGSGRLTQVAATLSQSVPAIMMELMITKLSFRSTNHDIGGRVTTIIMDGRGLSNMDLTKHYELFKNRLQNEVLHDVSYGNLESYMIEMHVDMFGDTIIDINMQGENARYCTPSFCDNLTVPVIANNEAQFSNLVSGFDLLVNQVTGELTNANVGYRAMRL